MNLTEIENLFDRLFPIARSISGNGLRKSLGIIGEFIPLEIIEYKSGSKVFDWTIPDEWNIRDAYIMDSKGHKFAEFSRNNLHVMGYSIPFKGRVSKAELMAHMHFLPEKPDAVPFVTSYYKRDWGFCISKKEVDKMSDDFYDVLIDSSLEPGSISIGEFYQEGLVKDEVIMFSHIGHPSMANDQLSGPIALTAIAKWLINNKNSLRYSYRLILAPETIGSISYICNNFRQLKRRAKGGFSVVCTADNGDLTYRTTKHKNSHIDFPMINALRHSGMNYRIEDFNPIGCDERHFNSHGVGIPMGSIMRTPPGRYYEYHTSLDNKSFISFNNLLETVEIIKESLLNIESDCRVYAIHRHCEPKLDKYGLYPTESNKNKASREAQLLISIWAYADGSTLSEISEKLGIKITKAREYANKLAKHKIIRIKDKL
jgi:aminopeptidase-like protein